MFSGYEGPMRRRWNPPLLVSITLHGILLLGLIYHRLPPIYAVPSSLAFGDGQKTYHVVYVAPGAEDSADSLSSAISLNAPVHKPRRQRGAVIARKEPVKIQEGEVSDHSAHAGSPYGSLLEGPITGHDVRPAFPVVFPDPPIVRSELAREIQGDVVVEVTIDAQGNVIDTSLLQSIGHGLDEKVLATLRNWRFKPAMMDGVPIASKHDVRFHFPS